MIFRAIWRGKLRHLIRAESGIVTVRRPRHWPDEQFTVHCGNW